MTSGSYLRFPYIHRGLLAFIAEDDVWVAPLDGGRAYRLSVDRVRVSHPRISPDGAHIAWTSWRDTDAELHIAPVDGGPARRLTYWAHHSTRLRGWHGTDTLLATSAHSQPFHFMTRAYAVPAQGGPAERLPYGPVSDLAVAGESTLLLTGAASHEPAHWKRYRGGGTGRLWLDGAPLPLDLPGQLACPMLVGDRVAFLSDHEGVGNLYSCARDGSGLTRHTAHEDFYARQAATDGTRVVYVRAGELWVLPDLSGEPEPLRVRLGGSGRGRQPHPAAKRPDDYACDVTGRASAVEVAGAVYWVPHEDGPVRALDVRRGVRARMPLVLGGPRPGDGEEESAPPGNGPVVWVSDASGEDGLEVLPEGGPPKAVAAGALGRVEEIAGAPDGSAVAVATHDGRLLLVSLPDGEVGELARSGDGVVGDLAFSPDSAWLAWSHPDQGTSRGIRLMKLADRTVVEATDGRFADSDPVFTLDGRYLAFLSRRGFDPIYDAHSFDLAFPLGYRPYLIPLQQGTPPPFGPRLGGRPVDPEDAPTVGEVAVDVDGLQERVLALPVAEGRYHGLEAVKDGLLWLRMPQRDPEPAGGGGHRRRHRYVLERFDFGKRAVEELDDEVSRYAVSGDRTRVVVLDQGDLRVMPVSGKKSDAASIDLNRIRLEIDPADRWRQAYAEAGRIMRDRFWVADMGGVDWARALDTYRPWLSRVGGPDDFADLLRELFGELGASHTYVTSGHGHGSYRFVGMLGADLVRDTDGLWRVRRVYAAETSDPHARSPLAGSGIKPGDALLAVDGHPVDPVTGPAPLLVDAADKPVELAVESGGRQFRAVVVPVIDDAALRYHAWVQDRRAHVRRLSGGRAGYLHVPDMTGGGWSQLHRDLSRELTRDTLIVDVRGNRGGNTSELVVEKLTRRIVGWTINRHTQPRSWPRDAPRGPVVVVCDEETCSDGDIIIGAVQSLKLGPVVGTRTWGGVIGFRGSHRLTDGTGITVPGYAHWSHAYGWELENRGAVPDVEVLITPRDWAAGVDTQLDTAVRLALEALAERPPAGPPDPTTRPERGRPRPHSG
ncbi:S41 family peptidase [Sinosporangium siamense]|uniref:Tricorn protease homolog n=1 Tax=Sinosporangium siamense TaxID=1367973 RepID=A0A919RK42_9ACTN|nr:S41 family peptidase [Sinosporangium siamense]GII95316.1 tricorn protease [Sinosporangium siamense]